MSSRAPYYDGIRMELGNPPRQSHKRFHKATLEHDMEELRINRLQDELELLKLQRQTHRSGKGERNSRDKKAKGLDFGHAAVRSKPWMKTAQSRRRQGQRKEMSQKWRDSAVPAEKGWREAESGGSSDTSLWDYLQPEGGEIDRDESVSRDPAANLTIKMDTRKVGEAVVNTLIDTLILSRRQPGRRSAAGGQRRKVPSRGRVEYAGGKKAGKGKPKKVTNVRQADGVKGATGTKAAAGAKAAKGKGPTKVPSGSKAEGEETVQETNQEDTAATEETLPDPVDRTPDESQDLKSSEDDEGREKTEERRHRLEELNSPSKEPEVPEPEPGVPSEPIEEKGNQGAAGQDDNQAVPIPELQLPNELGDDLANTVSIAPDKNLQLDKKPSGNSERERKVLTPKSPETPKRIDSEITGKGEETSAKRPEQKPEMILEDKSEKKLKKDLHQKLWNLLQNPELGRVPGGLDKECSDCAGCPWCCSTASNSSDELKVRRGRCRLRRRQERRLYDERSLDRELALRGYEVPRRPERYWCDSWSDESDRPKRRRRLRRGRKERSRRQRERPILSDGAETVTDDNADKTHETSSLGAKEVVQESKEVGESKENEDKRQAGSDAKSATSAGDKKSKQQHIFCRKHNKHHGHSHHDHDHKHHDHKHKHHDHKRDRPGRRQRRHPRDRYDTRHMRSQEVPNVLPIQYELMDPRHKGLPHWHGQEPEYDFMQYGPDYLCTPLSRDDEMWFTDFRGHGVPHYDTFSNYGELQAWPERYDVLDKGGLLPNAPMQEDNQLAREILGRHHHPHKHRTLVHGKLASHSIDKETIRKMDEDKLKHELKHDIKKYIQEEYDDLRKMLQAENTDVLIKKVDEGKMGQASAGDQVQKNSKSETGAHQAPSVPVERRMSDDRTTGVEEYQTCRETPKHVLDQNLKEHSDNRFHIQGECSPCAARAPCVPSFATPLTAKKMKLLSTERLLGEIAYQLEKKILDCTLAVKDCGDKALRSHLCGFTTQNVAELLRKRGRKCLPKSPLDGRNKYAYEQAFLNKYHRIQEQLLEVGYDSKHHAEFGAKIVNTYGVICDPRVKKALTSLEERHMPALWKVLKRLCATRGEYCDMLVLVRSLVCMARVKGEPIFNC